MSTTCKLRFMWRMVLGSVNTTSYPPLRLTTRNPSSEDIGNVPWQCADSKQTPVPHFYSPLPRQLPSSNSRSQKWNGEARTQAAERNVSVFSVRLPQTYPHLTPHMSQRMWDSYWWLVDPNSYRPIESEHIESNAYHRHEDPGLSHQPPKGHAALDLLYLKNVKIQRTNE